MFAMEVAADVNKNHCFSVIASRFTQVLAFLGRLSGFDRGDIILEKGFGWAEDH